MEKSYKKIQPKAEVSELKDGVKQNIYNVERYQAIFNSPKTMQLSKFNTNCVSGEFDAINNRVIYNIEDLEISVSNKKIKDKKIKSLFEAFTPNTAKVVDVLSLILARDVNTEKLCETYAPIVSFTIDEYLALSGKESTKSNRDVARRNLTAALKAIHATQLTFKDTVMGEVKTFIDVDLCVKKGVIENNVVMFQFSPDFALYLAHSYITCFDTKIFCFDSNNQNAYPLYRKLLTHYSMDNNIKRGTNNVISVRTALECCPDIPTREKIKNGNRQYGRIKDSLMRALSYIEDHTGMKWRFCTAGGQDLDDSKIEITYDEFMSLYIKFELEGFPDQSERIAAKEKARKAKERARKRAAEQKKKRHEEG